MLYSEAELGVSDPAGKIKQIVLGHRLLYSDVFSFVATNGLSGYIVFANTDIFLDDTIAKIRHSNLHSKKQMYALLRYEYDPVSKKSKLFGPRYDSQDTWIFHSDQNIARNEEKGLRFAFGKPGCDNKFVYMASVLGYELFNDPLSIWTHHYHTSQSRNYSVNDRLGPPYSVLIPNGVPLKHISASFGRLSTIDIGKWSNHWSRFNWEKDNALLKHWISQKREKGQKFAICANMVLDDLAVADLPQSYSNLEKGKAASYYGSALFNSPIVNLIVGKTALEAYHFIHFGPWTWSLRGSKLLFVIYSSAKVADNLREKWSIREQIYDCDFFPECSADFIYSDNPNKSLRNGDKYDVIITDEGVRLATDEFKKGRSVIVLESVLSLLFGTFDTNQMKMRPDILRLYMNQFWTKMSVL